MERGATTLVNGEAVAHISISDRGLAYGDGLFETIAVVDGQPCLWDKHCARLLHGCRRLAIAFDEGDALENEVFALSQQLVGHGTVKVIITRGGAAAGYRPAATAKPTRIVHAQQRQSYSPALYRDGVLARFCRQPLSISAELCGIKHLCRLEQVLARMEWDDEYHEGIMFDERGSIIEGTMSNLFIIKNSAVKTPKLDCCGIHGVLREWVLEQCEQHRIAVSESRLDRQSLLEADGLFFCNALIRIWPVRRLHNQSHDVAYDVAVVHRLLQQFNAADLGVAL